MRTLCTLLLLLLTTAPAHAESVVLIQESNGFPGGDRSTKPDDRARQQVVIDGEKLRVLDIEHMWALFIDLDAEQVREASIDRKEYVERGFAHYRKYAKERADNLREQAIEWRRLYERAEDDPKRQRALVADYTRAGGDPKSPGKIVARKQHFPQDARKATLIVDRNPVEVTLQHYMIRENQAARPIFDLWITKDVTLPTDLLRFYRKLGTFSPEVTKALTDVPGTVIECKAILDTGTLHKEFVSKIVEVRTAEVVRGSLTVPASWTKVDPEEKKAKAAAAPMRLCAVCQAPITKDVYKYTWKRRRHYACSQAHRVELIKRVTAQRRK